MHQHSTSVNICVFCRLTNLIYKPQLTECVHQLISRVLAFVASTLPQSEWFFLSPRRTFPFAGVSTLYYFFLFAAHSVCLAIHATLCCAANVEQGQKEEVQSAAHRD